MDRGLWAKPFLFQGKSSTPDFSFLLSQVGSWGRWPLRSCPKATVVCSACSLHCGSFVTNFFFWCLRYIKRYFPSPHKHIFKIPIKRKLDWPPRTSQLIKMIPSPLCLTVSRVIGAFHRNRLEKCKSKAKVYVFCVNNHLPTVWFLSQSCSLLTGSGLLAGWGSHPRARVLITPNFQALLKDASVTKASLQTGLWWKDSGWQWEG